MQSYEKHMEQLAHDENPHQDMMEKAARELGGEALTLEELNELQKRGIVAVPTDRLQAASEVMLGSVAAVKAALNASGRSRNNSQPKQLSLGNVTREDFPSRQAWRQYQRQLAKGQIK